VAEALYPTWGNVGISEADLQSQEVEYKKDFLFDFETGDFVVDGQKNVAIAVERSAWVQWCLKQCQIERFALLAYNTDAGIETALVDEQDTRKGKESVLERTLTEALMIDKRTASVSGFSFDWGADFVNVQMTVTPTTGVPVQISTAITN
jgi:hypothetical protein